MGYDPEFMKLDTWRQDPRKPKERGWKYRNEPFSTVLKNTLMCRLFKNAPMQGAQKLKERGVYEKYVER